MATTISYKWVVYFNWSLSGKDKANSKSMQRSSSKPCKGEAFDTQVKEGNPFQKHVDQPYFLGREVTSN